MNTERFENTFSPFVLSYANKAIKQGRKLKNDHTVKTRIQTKA